MSTRCAFTQHNQAVSIVWPIQEHVPGFGTRTGDWPVVPIGPGSASLRQCDRDVSQVAGCVGGDDGRARVTRSYRTVGLSLSCHRSYHLT